MTELLNIASYYIQGKPVYPSIRRVLNLLLNFSIASFIYEKCYGPYTWYDYNDYKQILDFFIKGKFFIPFSIFVVVYAVTQFLAVVSFIALNHFKSIKLQREILSYQYKKENIDEGLEGVQVASKIIVPIELTPELMIEAYQELRKQIKPEVFQEIERELKEPRHNLQANFIVGFRILIAITIFKSTLPLFGWGLYSITTLILLFGMFIMVLSYWILDILPTILRKFHVQAEEYLKEHIKDNPEKIEIGVK